MLDFISQFHPVIQALFATLFTWGVTALGAASVFTTRRVNQKLLDVALGFAGGVMLAASFFSLLLPAITLSETMDVPRWLPAVVGFLLGAATMRIIDFILPHLHIRAPIEEAEGLKTTWERSLLLILAITLHNLPEGLAVGVAFGGAAAGIEGATVAGAIALAIGIGLQNFPEGIAVAMPLRREGLSPLRSFWYGQLSAVVEPVAGVLGAAAVLLMRPILPYALAFAAGAMIFVVVEEVIPTASREGSGDIATMGVIIGFAVMTLLDVALG